MTPCNRRLNPYIRRMAEDMQVRNLAPATIDAYTFHVDKFCQFFCKSADQLEMYAPGELAPDQVSIAIDSEIAKGESLGVTRSRHSRLLFLSLST